MQQALPPSSQRQTIPPTLQATAIITSVLIVCYWTWGLVHGMVDVATFNDFEVYHYIGSIAAERSDAIYSVLTPNQQRGPFLYPPSAAMAFVPLSWLSHHAAGVVFSIIRMICLAMLWWGAVRFACKPATPSISPSIDKHLFIFCVLAIAVILHRSVWSDIGNGQINIILAACSVGGIWLMMRSRKWWWIGSLTLALAIAIKMTPALLLAVLLLNRHWKGLATTIAVTLVLMVALPIAWFGYNASNSMHQQYRQIAQRFTFDWAAPHEQTTPTELLQFIRFQTGSASLTPPDARHELPVPISGNAGRWLLDPHYRTHAMQFWLVSGLLAGIAFLIWRWHFMKPAQRSISVATPVQRDWTWDVAMLCALIVLLSPRAQKAHMVMLIVPVGWLAVRMLATGVGSLEAVGRVGAAGAVAGWRHIMCGRAGLRLAFGAMALLVLIGESVRIPVSGWDLPLRCLPLLGVLTVIVMLALIGWRDARSIAVSSASNK